MLSTVRLLTAAFVLSQACTIAQLSAHDQNLGACKDGWSLCDRRTLTPTELAEVSRARHFKNIADCRSGLPSCDQSQLTPSEANSVAVANYQRNLSDCKFGLESCDHSKQRLNSSASRNDETCQIARMVQISATFQNSHLRRPGRCKSLRISVTTRTAATAGDHVTIQTCRRLS